MGIGGAHVLQTQTIYCSLYFVTFVKYTVHLRQLWHVKSKVGMHIGHGMHLRNIAFVLLKFRRKISGIQYLAMYLSEPFALEMLDPRNSLKLNWDLGPKEVPLPWINTVHETYIVVNLALVSSFVCIGQVRQHKHCRLVERKLYRFGLICLLKCVFQLKLNPHDFSSGGMSFMWPKTHFWVFFHQGPVCEPLTITVEVLGHSHRNL